MYLNNLHYDISFTINSHNVCVCVFVSVLKEKKRKVNNLWIWKWIGLKIQLANVVWIAPLPNSTIGGHFHSKPMNMDWRGKFYFCLIWQTSVLVLNWSENFLLLHIPLFLYQLFFSLVNYLFTIFFVTNWSKIILWSNLLIQMRLWMEINFAFFWKQNGLQCCVLFF